MKQKSTRPRPVPNSIAKTIEIPLGEIDTSQCDERRGEPVVLRGMKLSIEVAGQTSTALVAQKKRRGKWVLLDGRRIYEALKELGAPTIIAEVADADPARVQLQVVHRNNVMPHSASAKVRLLVQWRIAYESLFKQATKHGGDRRKQARTDAPLSFRRMAAAEWQTTPSTIGRYLLLKDAPDEVLRDLDDGQLTLTEAGALVECPAEDHQELMATKNARKAGARHAAAEAIERSRETDRARLWEMLRSIQERVRTLYPNAEPARIERVAGATWLDALALVIGEDVATIHHPLLGRRSRRAHHRAHHAPPEVEVGLRPLQSRPSVGGGGSSSKKGAGRTRERNLSLSKMKERPCPGASLS